MAAAHLGAAVNPFDPGTPEFRAWERQELRHGSGLPDSAGFVERTGFARTLQLRSQLRDLPPIEPLVEGVISLRSTIVLVGPTGAGKTFLALSWACSIGTGHDWLGRPVRRVPVLYTVGEGAYGLDDRISAWEQAWDTKVDDGDVFFAVRPASLRDIQTWIEMQQEATTRGCRVIILDTFSSLASDADETKDAPVIMRRMADLAAAIDGSVVLIHHPGWGDATRARGGSQLEANADEVLILHGSNGSDLVELERKKVKEGPGGAKTWLRRRALYGSMVIESVSTLERAEQIADTAEQIARLVFSDPFSKAQLRDALMERMALSRTGAYEHITALKKSGAMRWVSGKGRVALYEMA